MKVFIAFFALYSVLHSFILKGARFQALVASFMKVEVDFSETPSSWSLPFVIDLELLLPFDISIF